ncbi:MAG: helicase-related protein, partial [bacterium]|nr:helicase-related protein [bacterium]
IKSQLEEGHLSKDERIQLITDIEALHTFSGIINRTLRRDIGDFTIRKPETVLVDFTSSQKQFHDELLQIQSEIFSRLHGDRNVKFMMTTIRRQAASCLYGLAPFLEDILGRHIDELSWDEIDNEVDVIPDNVIDTIKGKIGIILEKAKHLDVNDPKLEALCKIIRDKQTLPNNKIMLFSSFRHTLYYLYEHLQKTGFRVGMIHGGVNDDERLKLRRHFEMPREHNDGLDILLFSEVGCEGLDYQFCDCIVNYDLPWNPMRIEQRIGRIDRNGQKSESVAIFNLIIPGTVDADIYERCLFRIGVFNNALGGNEEILGEITREIRNIAENISLTEDERGQKFQQLADNKIRLIREQDDLEQKQLELFGINLPETRMKKEIEEASSFWLSSTSISRLILFYLKKICGQEHEYLLGEKQLKTLRLSQEARNVILKDFQKLPRQNSSAYREWENWLKGSEQHLTVTFESECAIQHPEAVFIMPLHPLVKQAANSFDGGGKIVTVLKVKSELVPPGKYEFSIYQWQFYGIKEDLVLRPIASSEAVTAHLTELLEKAEAVQEDKVEDKEISVWDNLDEQHYKLWSAAREKHRQKTRDLAKYRRESLSISHRARINLLEEQLRKSDNEKIKKMKQSQLATADADYSRRLQDLDIAVERADITATPVAYGILYVTQ